MKDPLCCASTTAAVDPIIPTLMPYVKFVSPTATPAAKTPYAFLLDSWKMFQELFPGVAILNLNSPGLDESKIVTITS